METALEILHIAVCIGMLPVILLQSGKGGGVSAVFGGGGSGTVFGSRGASNFLTRTTTVCAVVFMITSMTLSWMSSRDRSVVGDIPVEAATTGSSEVGSSDGDDQAALPVDEESSTSTAQ